MSSELHYYLLNSLPGHLALAGQQERLADLLSDYYFIQDKIKTIGSQALVYDYNYTSESDLLFIQDAVLLSSHIFILHPSTSIASQLYGRLFQFRALYIQKLLSQIDNLSEVWLKPITPGLTPPNSILIRTIEAKTDAVASLAITMDERYLIATYRDRQTKIWDISQGSELEIIQAIPSIVNAIAVLNNSTVIFGDQDGFITIWDLGKRQIVVRFQSHSDPINNLRAIPTLSQFVTTSKDYIGIWVLSDVIERVHFIHSPEIRALAITSDEQNIITGHTNGEILIWRISDGKKIHSWVASSVSINDIVSLTLSQKLLSIDAGYSVALWDYKGNQIWKLSGMVSRIDEDSCLIRANPNDEVAVSSFGSRKNILRLIDLIAGKELYQIKAHGWPITSLMIIEDGKKIISGSQDARIKVWKLLKNKIGNRNTIGHLDDVSSVYIAPNEETGISCSLDGTAKLWDLETGNLLSTFHDPGSFLYKAEITKNNKYLITGGYPGSVTIWDLSTNEIVNRLKNQIESATNFVLSHDNSRIITIVKNSITIWSINANDYFQQYTFPERLLDNIAYDNNDYTVFLTTNLNEILVFDIKEERIIDIFNGHSKAIIKLLLIDNGRKLLSASEDAVINVWDLSTGKANLSLMGHTGGVKDIVVLPGERELLSASSDGTMRLWDLASGKILRILRGHDSIVWKICVSHNGKEAVSISGDESIIVWNLNEGNIITQFSLENRPTSLAATSGLERILVGEIGGNIDLLKLASLK